ncbi:MAG: hypothetical protein EOP47_11005 [Sphingobacteriaceae bacterium]|nr:MAG: hypothetical protein EOP47_11005 [Sphingobacteriaceae bacterium]
MKFLLSLKAWQLFLIFFLFMMFGILPYVGQLIKMIWWFIYIGWIYSVGIAMRNIIPGRFKPNIIYFQYCCLFTCIMAVVFYVFGNNISGNDSMAWLVVLSFFISTFYIFSFSARMLESAILGKKVGFLDSIRSFFFFWFFPFGFWYIQPAMQRVLTKYESKINVSPDL